MPENKQGKQSSYALRCNHKAKPANEMTEDEIYQLQFKDAARIISQLDTFEKSSLANAILKRREAIYYAVETTYDAGLPPSEAMSPKVFQTLMRRVSHWEVLLYWVYEMDIIDAEDLEAHMEEADKIVKSETARNKVRFATLGKSEIIMRGKTNELIRCLQGLSARSKAERKTPKQLLESQPDDVKALLAKLGGGK